MKDEQEFESKIYAYLEDVKDPEIPVLSIVDMGIVKEIHQKENGIEITITPTFVGCPALDLIKSEIIRVITSKGIKQVEVIVSYKQPWSSNDISETGRKALKKFGLAPPPTNLIEDIAVLEHAVCPRCGEDNTEMRSIFGATLCRSIHYCFKCLESFEQFKPL